MHYNKLHIFSKNTDAFASQRGYNYQTLITLEAWANNLKNVVEEDIFCEYEEDIFHKNKFDNSVKFRQIKLYSSNFSFKSEEIIKCIAHFFMLHVKSEYYSFDKEFVFETNSNIAKAYSNNEADLLREWFDNQESLNEERLQRISQKVKEIVTTYIKDQKKTITKDDNEEIVKEAISVFEKIDDEFWISFIKLIKWKFLNEESDVEFENAKSRIENVLIDLDYKIDNDNIKQVFGVLLERVFTKASQEKHDDRKLTTRDLDLLILDIGNEEDKWYSRKYEYYSKFEKIDDFRIGEFYEIIDLVNYCRRKKYLIRHKEIWNKLLDFYVNDNNLQEIYKRKAIYELIFLNNEFHEVDYENLSNRQRPTGNLAGFEEAIRYYFRNINSLKNIDDLEYCQTILNLIMPPVLEGKISVTNEEFREWCIQLYRVICKALEFTVDVNEKCHLLEEKGNFLLLSSLFRKNQDFLKCFEDILNFIDEAPLFKVSQFGDRINKYIKSFINIDPEDKSGLIRELEGFSEKLYPFVEKREGKVRLAHQQVEKGVAFLKTSYSFGLLKALESFHKAKDNYQQADTIEGFILGLLNISQLYSSLGMNFAGKYYALCAFRMSINNEFIKHTEKSFAMMFYADYKSGSWFNALEIYYKYIYLRDQSNLENPDCLEEGKITQRMAFILYAMKRLSSQFSIFVESQIKALDYIGEEIVKPIFNSINKELDTDEKFNKVLNRDFNDFPLNDIGKNRTIDFFALGCLWKISFENSFETTSVAEEFISTIQIILTEISLYEADFHLLKSTIEVELVLSDVQKPPVQHDSNDITKWTVFINHFDNPNPEKINQHTVYNTVSLQFILNRISLLKENEFRTMFFDFIKDRGLDGKQITVNLYQRIHRDIYTVEDFDFSKKTDFLDIEFDNLSMPKENKIMKWNATLSEKYTYERAIEAIKNRFNNVHNSIHITLEKLKMDKEFPDFINELRKEGWKDWQIILNIFNFIINYKINKFEKFDSDNPEEIAEYFKLMLRKYHDMDEKDCYVEFPLKAFKTKEFKAQFNISFASIIQSYGLESKSHTPNLNAIKEFMDIRFNLKDDDYNENNPLKDIKFI
ncbi:dsDNA nuclease domain-containing protein [Flavobacterium limnophilum]|uniref:dsDNA nuclease domain-containing protein n=1 Tax=Flavobacterium limnophilum TaxID=3003262 RepID=UPI002483133C|nr:dsDNA nuclease domain-containing protein [Flavobacterium limnophilum]